MSQSGQPLPEFGDPPVSEVALSVQFETLKLLRANFIGFLWDVFRAEYPHYQEQAPLNPVIERFGAPATSRTQVSLEMMQTPPLPRCWFLNDEGDGTELIQVQQDRFVHNWRKLGDDEKYPRYEKHIRPTFKVGLEKFRDFLEREKIGELIPNQCEVTYINHILSGRGWNHHGEIDKVLSVVENCHSSAFLPPLEDGRIELRYVMSDPAGQPIGRLHINLQPGYRKSDATPLYLLTLTARGKPIGDGIEGVLNFMDLGRKWVVCGFDAITTKQMHTLWSKKDG